MIYAFRKDKKGWRAISDESEVLPDETISYVIPELDTRAEDIITRRNTLLKASDWTQVADVPFTVAVKKQWAAYRKELRDITKKEGFPENTTWPKEPE